VDARGTPETDDAVDARAAGTGLVRVAAITAAVLVLGAVGAAALTRVGADPVAASTPTSSAGSGAPTGVGLTPAAAEPADATDTATPPPLDPAQDTLVLGDSLGLAVYPWLADLVPDRYVSYQAEVGRSTPATARKLAALSAVPPVVIVSSGTNDSVANVLEDSAREILDELGRARCVVWVDVARPDRVGDSQSTMNAALARAVSGRTNVRILHWSDLIDAHPEWMSGDGIHPNEAGSQARAQAFADAARSCSALDPDAPRARRQYLPQSAFLGPVSGQYRSPSAPSRGTTASTRTPSSSPSRTPTPSATASGGSGSTAPAPATSSPTPSVTATPTQPAPPATVTATPAGSDGP